MRIASWISRQDVRGDRRCRTELGVVARVLTVDEVTTEPSNTIFSTWPYKARIVDKARVLFNVMNLHSLQGLVTPLEGAFSIAEHHRICKLCLVEVVLLLHTGKIGTASSIDSPCPLILVLGGAKLGIEGSTAGPGFIQIHVQGHRPCTRSQRKLKLLAA